jgi:hypothetical protein
MQPWARYAVEPKPDAPYHPDLPMRVSRLESDVQHVKATMGRLEMLVVGIKATLKPRCRISRRKPRWPNSGPR